MTVWARGLGVTLVPVDAASVEGDAVLRRALLDSVPGGYPAVSGQQARYDGSLPEAPRGTQWHLVREHGATVGALAIVRDRPRRGEAALFAIAIAEEHRGHATGTKALLVAERRLLREGVSRLVTRVPRTNGRGLYFMLRAGFTPVTPAEAPRDSSDATWFARCHRAAG